MKEQGYVGGDTTGCTLGYFTLQHGYKICPRHIHPAWPVPACQFHVIWVSEGMRMSGSPTMLPQDVRGADLEL